MPDYSKSIIYTIRSKTSLYVGSTTDFTNRKHQHKTDIFKTISNSKLYKTIRDNEYQWDMKPYKEFPCENKLQLTIEEERVRVLLNADLNTNCCGSGIDYNDVDYNKKICSLYYDTNKDEINKRHTKYREVNKDKIKKHRDENKDKIKQYYETHKDEINKQRGV